MSLRGSMPGQLEVLAPSWVDPAPVPCPTGELTPSRLFALELAQTMSPGELRRFDPSLQNIELGAERHVQSQTNALRQTSSVGMRLMDSIAPNETLVVYADGRKSGGVAVANPPLELLAASVRHAQALTVAQRRRTLIDRAVALRPKNRPDVGNELNDQLASVAEDLLVLAGLLLDHRDLSKLASIAGAIPAMAIVALTDTRGRPTVDTRHIVTRFPGAWLGTRSPAGSA